MVPRFFAPAATSTGSLVELPEDEAAHLVRVLRLKSGAAVRVFDGRGREWHGIVEETGRHQVSIRLTGDLVPPAEPRVRITLAVAVLKGDKMDDVVRDAVMLGVAAIRPLRSLRVEVSGRGLAAAARRARWRRIAVSSAKQCGRAVVPEVQETSTLSTWLDEGNGGMRIAFVEPASAGSPVRLADLPRSHRVELLVGPEGGWSPDEVDRLQATCQPVTLGSQTLRADAMPLIAITALRVAWHDL